MADHRHSIRTLHLLRRRLLRADIVPMHLQESGAIGLHPRSVSNHVGGDLEEPRPKPRSISPNAPVQKTYKGSWVASSARSGSAVRQRQYR